MSMIETIIEAIGIFVGVSFLVAMVSSLSIVFAEYKHKIRTASWDFIIIFGFIVGAVYFCMFIFKGIVNTWFAASFVDFSPFKYLDEYFLHSLIFTIIIAIIISYISAVRFLNIDKNVITKE